MAANALPIEPLRIERWAAVRQHVGKQVDPRTTHHVYAVWLLAKAQDPVCRVLIRREVNVRQLGNRVPNTFVDRTGHFPTHRVGERNVHVSSRHRGRHCLESIPDGHDNVGIQQLEQRRQFQEAKSGRLCHRDRSLALDDHVDARVRREAVVYDDINDRPEAVEERRGSRDDLESQVLMRLDCAHDRLDAAVVGTRTNHDANLTHKSLDPSPHHACQTAEVRSAALGR